MHTRPHTTLRVSGTGGREGTFVEEVTVTFTKHVIERWVFTQSELEALKIAEDGEDTDVKSLCHFPAIVPLVTGTLDPFLSPPPLNTSKAKVYACSRAIPGSSLPPTRTVTSLQLHCYCPLLLNLNGLDLAL